MPELTEFGKKIFSLCKTEDEFVEAYRLYAAELTSMSNSLLKGINDFFEEEVLSCFKFDEVLEKRLRKIWKDENAETT